jgi:hypothetical protein
MQPSNSFFVPIIVSICFNHSSAERSVLTRRQLPSSCSWHHPQKPWQVGVAVTVFISLTSAETHLFHDQGIQIPSNSKPQKSRLTHCKLIITELNCLRSIVNKYSEHRKMMHTELIGYFQVHVPSLRVQPTGTHFHSSSTTKPTSHCRAGWINYHSSLYTSPHVKGDVPRIHYMSL